MGKALVIKGSNFSSVALTTITLPTSTPAPTIKITNAGKVTITANDASVICYTTDGSTPTISSQKYSASFSVSTNTVVKAIAIYSEGSSDVSSKTYTIRTKTYVNSNISTDISGYTVAGLSSPYTFVPLKRYDTSLYAASIDGVEISVAKALTLNIVKVNSSTLVTTIIETVDLAEGVNDIEFDNTVDCASGEYLGIQITTETIAKGNTNTGLKFAQDSTYGSDCLQVDSYGTSKQITAQFPFKPYYF